MRQIQWYKNHLDQKRFDGVTPFRNLNSTSPLRYIWLNAMSVARRLSLPSSTSAAGKTFLHLFHSWYDMFSSFLTRFVWKHSSLKGYRKNIVFSVQDSTIQSNESWYKRRLLDQMMQLWPIFCTIFDRYNDTTELSRVNFTFPSFFQQFFLLYKFTKSLSLILVAAASRRTL